MTKPQPKTDARRQVARILDAALKLAQQKHYARISRDDIARACGFPSSSLITYHVGTMAALRRGIMREAIRRECLAVIAQGLAARDPHARKAPQELKEKALQSLAA